LAKSSFQAYISISSKLSLSSEKFLLRDAKRAKICASRAQNAILSIASSSELKADMKAELFKA
jgi:hypothetical protein